MAAEGRLALARERTHLTAGLHDLHRLLGRGAAEVAGEGATVTLTNGRSVLDFGSYAVTLLGHRPAPVVDAVRRALDTLPTSTRLLANPTTTALAARLVDAAGPSDRTRVLLGLNGSDVVEAALKLAMATSDRTGVLAVSGAFHGKTLGALAVTDDGPRRDGLEPLLAHARFVEPVASAVAEAAAVSPPAAVIVEPVQGEGGGRRIDPDVLRTWAYDVHAVGGFLIVDEIQVGLRRTGPLSLTAELGVDADAVLFGKPLGGGVMPLSAAVYREALHGPLAADPFFHTSTFGGHPLSCAAGLAAIDLLEASTDAVERIGTGLSRVLAGLVHHDIIARTWSAGAFGVLEATSVEAAQLLLLDAARGGLLLAPCLSAPQTLRLLPPLVATDDELDRASTVLEASCGRVRTRVAT